MAHPVRRIFLSQKSEFRNYPDKESFIAFAEKAVNLAGEVVSDMAYFAARDTQPASYCIEQVKNCDVYVGIIGFRYGSPVRDRDDVSYTELEFNTATHAGLPRLIFL